MEFEEIDPPWVSWGAAMPAGANVDPQLTRDLLTVMRYRSTRTDTGSNRLTAQQTQQIVDGLPHLTEEQLDELGHHESSCPICMNTHLASIAEEELAMVMDSPAHPLETLGVTRLSQTCGHIFCRKDLLTWIRDGHPSCPLCRTPFITPADAATSDAAAAADEEAPGENEFDEAMERLVAAYHEERRHMGAPRNEMFGSWTGQPQAPTVETPADDRSEFSGMYS
ncbi:hypothetical protein FA95DRAFT_1552077 [Auriscalpium vulgare]|uniref:Uncharacterized protein n=1 Tax=Auriscalpium vulgare TaxID=40419 RepID=A0ACB8SCC4_9AGAM|nr:hypothetical protein FA95DRAFT_1552077 [Auriscalpium vulgare]